MSDRDVEKFINDNYQSRIVQDLLLANEAGDRKQFYHLIREIHKCLSIKQDIKDMSDEIKCLAEDIQKSKYELRKIMHSELAENLAYLNLPGSRCDNGQSY